MASRFKRYNLWWQNTVDPASLELDMIAGGGSWTKTDGEIAGNGLEYHYKEFIRLVWPWVVQHRWLDLILKNYLTHRTVVLIGPASSSKTFSSALLVLVDYFAHPDCTTVICCSTTKERLQDRVWADIVKLFRSARKECPWLPGNIIEGRLRIVTDGRKDSPDGRDFRNGVIGVCAKRGDTFIGIGEFAGIKNKRVRLLGDELCFPLGTLVDTPSGRRRIESLQAGESIISAIGQDKVKATSLHYSDSLARVTTCDGRQIVCTPTHPFFTQSGWKKACELNEESFLLSAYEAMQILRRGNPNAWKESEMVRRVQSPETEVHRVRNYFPTAKAIPDSENLWAVLQCEVNAQPSTGRTVEEDRGWQTEVFSGEPRSFEGDSRSSPGLSMENRGQNKALQNDESSRCEAFDSRRQWNGTNQGRKSVTPNVPRWRLESWGQNRAMERKRVSSCLQSGLRISDFKAGNRSGRIYTQQSGTQGQRREEGQISYGSWVASVEILKPDDPEFRRTSPNGYRICNLRVEGHPSFSVNGFLVHNSMLPKSFCDAISNLDKNPDFKCIGLGNPKDTTDALGVLGEPSAAMGGWDGGIDQQFGTKTWPIRRDEGIAIQLPGDDSPNLDGQLGIPLISQADINRDVSFYGKDSMWFTMMDLGRMPKGQGSRRVLTKQLCLKYNAMDEPLWRGDKRTQIAFLDASYAGVGGDRCVFGVLEFGLESEQTKFSIPDSAIARSMAFNSSNRQIIALTAMMLVPIDPGLEELAEYQIAQYVRKQCEDRQIPPDDFFYDAGMRTSLCSAFSKVWGHVGMTVDFGGTPTDDPVSADIPTPCKDYYSKRVSQLWFQVRHAVEAGQVRGFTEDVIMEFSSREWMRVGANKIEVEPKQAVKEKIGRSPDLADAIACGFFGASQRGFRIARLKPDKPAKRTVDWREDLRKKAKNLWASGQLEYASS